MRRRIILTLITVSLLSTSAFAQASHKIRPMIKSELTLAIKLTNAENFRDAMELVERAAAASNKTADEKFVIRQTRDFVLVKSGKKSVTLQ
jgi:hypothetical protein